MNIPYLVIYDDSDAKCVGTFELIRLYIRQNITEIKQPYSLLKL